MSHIPARTRAGYDRLATLIEALPDEAPDPGWKRRILASLDALPVRDMASASRHSPGHRIWLVAGGLATAAAIAIVLALCNRVVEERPPAVAVCSPVRGKAVRGKSVRVAESMEPQLPVRIESLEPQPVIAEIRRSDTPHRSNDGASIGDTLILHIQFDRPSELRVYGDAGEPLARCSEARGCTVERSGKARRFQLKLVLRASGTVRAVLFTGDSIPGSFQNLNADVETAQRANVDARQVAFVHVQ
ncbi:MAG TPA: hypothetical protein VF469_15415 [Kofleriaceae bacterium]